ncbi:amidohydrolase [Marinilabiliaceae bacterium JC040]|nr:amidohydrolase [Marinilabiliaceae bacterium JC040]
MLNTQRTSLGENDFMEKTMNNLILALIQTDIVWEDVDKNLNILSNKFSSIEQDVDLIILPEMFASGFTMQGKEEISKRYSDILKWMQEQACKNNTCIIGSTIYKTDDKFFNRLLIVNSESVEFYDKHHLFTMGEESNHFTAGNKICQFEIKGWKIRPLICYDLRFPIWARNNDGYDLLTYSANWPASRKYPWSTLLKARAIENQAYVAGVNCVGEDGNKLKYSGNSVIIDYQGKEINKCQDFEEGIIISELSKIDLDKQRQAFPVLKDMDEFTFIK